MGLSGIGPGSLIVILIIVLLLFGSKRIRSMGGDIANAIKSFRRGMTEDEKSSTEKIPPDVEQTNNKAPDVEPTNNKGE